MSFCFISVLRFWIDYFSNFKTCQIALLPLNLLGNIPMIPKLSKRTYLFYNSILKSCSKYTEVVYGSNESLCHVWSEMRPGIWQYSPWQIICQKLDVYVFPFSNAWIRFWHVIDTDKMDDSQIVHLFGCWVWLYSISKKNYMFVSLQ